MSDLYKIYLTIDDINELNIGLKFIHRQRKEQMKNVIKNRDNTIIRRKRTRKINKLLIIGEDKTLKLVDITDDNKESINKVNSDSDDLETIPLNTYLLQTN